MKSDFKTLPLSLFLLTLLPKLRETDGAYCHCTPVTTIDNYYPGQRMCLDLGFRRQFQVLGNYCDYFSGGALTDDADWFNACDGDTKHDSQTCWTSTFLGDRIDAEDYVQRYHLREAKEEGKLHNEGVDIIRGSECRMCDPNVVCHNAGCCEVQGLPDIGRVLWYDDFVKQILNKSLQVKAEGACSSNPTDKNAWENFQKNVPKPSSWLGWYNLCYQPGDFKSPCIVVAWRFMPGNACKDKGMTRAQFGENDAAQVVEAGMCTLENTNAQDLAEMSENRKVFLIIPSMVAAFISCACMSLTRRRNHQTEGYIQMID